MYNLIVGFQDGEAFPSRVGEHTDEVVWAYVAPAGRLDTSRLLNLPALVMPETGLGDEQIARVGSIESLALSGRNYRFKFVPNALVPPIPSERIEAAAGRLGITDWEFQRTHWAVKDVDLYRVVHEDIVDSRPAPKVFRLPTMSTRERDLVAVMMPFDSRFGPVQETLRQAAADVGLRCLRADDIWDHHVVMDDVASLLWRAQVVIADFTGRNPNVFYETGIAHTFGRDVIPIAQSKDDVPFDLGALRYIHYRDNGEGLEELRSHVARRLATLVARAVI
ncbi:hypothetical protein [Paractinoplanes toevensis]|uniref:Uncharacterized protein n=1 Tax=Paractinoplanes toevensis TaxID=571911 RepID=A0A920BPZ9_9ACTN|nr:hypothetical protein [Actinoplanes toevensis]GIM96854.1 hypothetical protein Ato02nite_086470 [Actinoplanes toevensis]